MSNTPYLDFYAKNLNESVKKQLESHAIGRDKEISQLIQILMHANKSNPFLVGEPGVGKTALVEGAAYLLNQGQVPEQLENYQIYSLNLGILDTNAAGKIGYFNANFSNIIQECIDNRDHIILFIDEFHTLMGASRKEGSGMDGSQLLKAPLARGEIHVIGATTFDEYHDFVEDDKALQRRFDVIPLQEPDEPTSVQILQGSLGKYFRHYGDNIEISNKIIKDIVSLSVRYLTENYLPDKAFDLLDASIGQCVKDKRTVVNITDVAYAIYLKTNIPVSTIASSLNPTVYDLKNVLKRRVKGQDDAIDQIVKAVDLSFVSLNNPNQPLASFLFLGTTGVGKTEMGLAMAEGLFQDETNMIRLDMAEFNTKDAVERLLGSGNKRGILTEAVRRKPYGILLLDEIEKAHPIVWDLLLSILDAGEIQYARGRNVNFKNVIIIMTTNLAANTIKTKEAWKADRQMSKEEQRYRQNLFHKRIDLVLQRTFRPEFVNRLGNRIVFNILDKEEVILIAKKYLDVLSLRLEKVGYHLLYDYDVIDYLTDMGTDTDNGARPLQRVIDQQIAGKLAELLLQAQQNDSSKLKQMTTFVMSVKGDRPSKIDKYGSREFVFKARLNEPSEDEKKEQSEIFSPKNVHKMVQQYMPKPEITDKILQKIQRMENNK